MALSSETVKTDVDVLFELIKRKKELSFAEASKALSLPVSTIEAWASFLEEEGFVSVKYKFTTPFFVYKKDPQQKYLSQEPSAILDDISSLLQQIQVQIQKKDYTRAMQNCSSIREKIARLPNDFIIQKQHEVNSIKEIVRKLETTISDLSLKK